ncbi:CopG family transcriptional regulator [Candidatus Curtissbacteria bacterium]|nr:CopG family transcriptional regulator [Candidatus Curtissbacteria bacterium]
MSTQRVIMNISVPRAIAKQIEAMAKKENKTKSELMREAFRSYKSDKEWARIWAWGRETARRMRIETEDDVERIAG